MTLLVCITASSKPSDLTKLDLRSHIVPVISLVIKLITFCGIQYFHKDNFGYSALKKALLYWLERVGRRVKLFGIASSSIPKYKVLFFQQNVSEIACIARL